MLYESKHEEYEKAIFYWRIQSSLPIENYRRQRSSFEPSVHQLIQHCAEAIRMRVLWSPHAMCMVVSVENCLKFLTFYCLFVRLFYTKWNHQTQLSMNFCSEGSLYENIVIKVTYLSIVKFWKFFYKNLLDHFWISYHEKRFTKKINPRIEKKKLKKKVVVRGV